MWSLKFDVKIFFLISFFHHATPWKMTVDKPMEIQKMIPAHLDFQKLGDLFINKSKYKLLKPAVHSVRDHFQDTMMRRDTELPSDRVFLDENGFRHFWNVYSEQKSLRRLIPENEVDVIEGQEETTTKKKTGIARAKPKPKPKTTTAKPKTTKEGPKRKSPGRYSVRKKKLEEKQRAAKALRSEAAKKNEGNNDGKERTLVKTTFFCPFFGVMTMHSYLDDEVAKPAEEKEDGDNKEEDAKADDGKD